MVSFKRLVITAYKTQKIKLILTLSLFLLYIFIWTLYTTEDENSILVRKFKEERLKVSLQRVVLHLDLKGAPPKLAYLRQLLPILKRHCVNSLLMEYEDMFPYENRLAKLSSPHKYSKHELKRFLIEAVLYGFEIIPLVQTFGHLEFVLKVPQFKHLRENPDQMDSICPSKNESLTLLKEMLTQNIKFHENIAPLNHIHIGCDEVKEINRCRVCQRRKVMNSELFI